MQKWYKVIRVHLCLDQSLLTQFVYLFLTIFNLGVSFFNHVSHYGYINNRLMLMLSAVRGITVNKQKKNAVIAIIPTV